MANASSKQLNGDKIVIAEKGGFESEAIPQQAENQQKPMSNVENNQQNAKEPKESQSWYESWMQQFYELDEHASATLADAQQYFENFRETVAADEGVSPQQLETEGLTAEMNGNNQLELNIPEKYEQYTDGLVNGLQNEEIIGMEPVPGSNLSLNNALSMDLKPGGGSSENEKEDGNQNDNASLPDLGSKVGLDNALSMDLKPGGGSSENDKEEDGNQNDNASLPNPSSSIPQPFQIPQLKMT